VILAAIGGLAGVACLADLPDNAVTLEQVARGRLLAVQSDCSGCHNNGRPAAVHNPDHPRWLAGLEPGAPPFQVGPLAFKTRPRNLTPDNTTGLGRFTPRQLFNALRYGLRPGETPDVAITSTTPGEGNFPAAPKYLAPPMPWHAIRHKPDQELWDIIAYLQHGIKPVSNKVEDSEGPPDFWASGYTADKIGPYPLPVFPAGSEEFKP
jgi:hypothetical protein